MSRYGIEFIDILKLDIEGAELEVFETSESWIGKVGMLAVETHDRFRPGCSKAFERVGVSFPQRFRQGEIEFASRARVALNLTVPGIGSRHRGIATHRR